MSSTHTHVGEKLLKLFVICDTKMGNYCTLKGEYENSFPVERSLPGKLHDSCALNVLTVRSSRACSPEKSQAVRRRPPALHAVRLSNISVRRTNFSPLVVALLFCEIREGTLPLAALPPARLYFALFLISGSSYVLSLWPTYHI